MLYFLRNVLSLDQITFIKNVIVDEEKKLKQSTAKILVYGKKY